MEKVTGEWVSLKLSEIDKGDIVKHKSGGKTFLINANYGNRATGVSSVDITNEQEWLVFKK